LIVKDVHRVVVDDLIQQNLKRDHENLVRWCLLVFLVND